MRAPLPLLGRHVTERLMVPDCERLQRDPRADFGDSPGFDDGPFQFVPQFCNQ
jgi:hypothetical protein